LLTYRGWKLERAFRRKEYYASYIMRLEEFFRKVERYEKLGEEVEAGRSRILRRVRRIRARIRRREEEIREIILTYLPELEEYPTTELIEKFRRMLIGQRLLAYRYARRGIDPLSPEAKLRDWYWELLSEVVREYIERTGKAPTPEDYIREGLILAVERRFFTPPLVRRVIAEARRRGVPRSRVAREYGLRPEEVREGEISRRLRLMAEDYARIERLEVEVKEVEGELLELLDELYRLKSWLVRNRMGLYRMKIRVYTVKVKGDIKYAGEFQGFYDLVALLHEETLIPVADWYVEVEGERIYPFWEQIRCIKADFVRQWNWEDIDVEIGGAVGHKRETQGLLDRWFEEYAEHVEVANPVRNATDRRIKHGFYTPPRYPRIRIADLVLGYADVVPEPVETFPEVPIRLQRLFHYDAETGYIDYDREFTPPVPVACPRIRRFARDIDMNVRLLMDLIERVERWTP